jgi:hypothetical protein
MDPPEQMSPFPHLKMETDPVFEMTLFIYLFRILGDRPSSQT